jgi:hypothetical protein
MRAAILVVDINGAALFNFVLLRIADAFHQKVVTIAAVAALSHQLAQHRANTNLDHKAAGPLWNHATGWSAQPPNLISRVPQCRSRKVARTTKYVQQ